VELRKLTLAKDEIPVEVGKDQTSIGKLPVELIVTFVDSTPATGINTLVSVCKILGVVSILILVVKLLLTVTIQFCPFG